MADFHNGSRELTGMEGFFLFFVEARILRLRVGIVSGPVEEGGVSSSGGSWGVFVGR